MILKDFNCRCTRTSIRVSGYVFAISCAAVVSTPTVAATRMVTSAACAQLVKLVIPAARIGLPTGGATVTNASVTLMPRRHPGSAGSYCITAGSIDPVDPTAPKIEFQVALPIAWNGKVVMLGGGGFDGSVPNVAGTALNMPADARTPLERGYAVFASDSGHQASVVDGAFLGNHEAYANWMGDALKKTRDAALVVTETAYGAAPTKSYFLGSSTGGREALAVAARWPQDWNRVVALYPGRNVTVQILGMLGSTQAFAAPGAFLSRAKRGILHRAAIAACDGLDGAVDGVISNVRRCDAEFDPSDARLNGVPIRCPGGNDTGDTCLSDSQIAALRKVGGALTFNFPLANGQTSYPGYDYLISDSGDPSVSPLSIQLSMLAIGQRPAAFPITPTMSLSAQLTDGFIRFAVTQDRTFNQLSFNVSNPGAFANRLTELSALDIADTNLTGFAAKGGKLLMMQGTEDLLVSARGTEDYYHRLRATMGVAKVAAFVRYFEVPGFGHAVSKTFNVSWDQLTALENWAENDVDPAKNQIVSDTVGVPGRTRPLCLYPSWPMYKGFGAVDSAASFRCVAQ